MSSKVQKLDIDTLLLTRGKNPLLELINKAKPYAEMKITKTLRGVKVNSIEDKRKYINILKKDIVKIKDNFIRKEYIRLLADYINLPFSDVHYEINKAEVAENPSLKIYDQKFILAQKFLIACLFLDENNLEALEIIKENSPTFTQDYKMLFDKINNLMNEQNNQLCIIEKLENELTEDSGKNILHDILFKASELDCYNEQELSLFIEQNCKILNDYWQKEIRAQKRAMRFRDLGVSKLEEE